MKRDKNIWVDAVVIIGLLILVYFLCQPFSRDWGDGISEMFTGNEGVYARDTDTYYYLRKASEFTENGIGSIRIFVESDDPLRTYNYTDSNEKTPMLLSALAALLWYALQSIGIKVSVYWLALRFNSMVLALCTIPIYMFLKKRISRMASFYGAAVAVLSKPFFSGSWQGAFDTDTLICFFAVTGILCLYESVLSDARRKRILYSIVATVTMIGLYCTWTMYFVYVIIAIATAAFGIIVSAIVIRRMPTWKECFAPVVAMLSWFAFAVVDSRLRLIKIFNSLFSSGKDIESWPNPASFVAEMQKPSFFAGDTVWDFFASREGAVIDYLGGGIKVIEIILSVVILVVLAIRCIKTGRVKTKKDESFLFSAIGSWFLGTLLMTFMGVRFFEFFILPCSLVLAFGMSAFFDSFQLQKPIERRVVAVCAAAIIFSVFVQWEPKLALVIAGVTLVVPVVAGRRVGKSIIPITIVIGLLSSQIEYSIFAGKYVVPYVSRPIETGMTWIKNNTPKDSVVVSSWGFGYAFQYYSKRRTMCDGGTYNGTFFYWLDTMLATSDLELSAGIARMLQGSGLDGTSFAETLCGGKKAAAELLKSILPLSRDEAQTLLRNKGNYTEEQIVRLLTFTHPKSAPEMYLVLDSYLIGYSPIIRIGGNWNFEGENEQEGAVFLGAYSVESPDEGNGVECELGVDRSFYGWKAKVYNVDGELHCFLTTPEGDRVDCNRVLFVRDGQKIYDRKGDEEHHPDDWLGRETIVLIEEAGRVTVIVCEDEMVDSTLFQLYVFNNLNQTVFTKVYEDTIPERITEEPSRVQRRIGSLGTNAFLDCGIMIWKINPSE